MIAMSVIGEFGYIYWNVPRSIYYRPGEEIQATLYIGNSTGSRRRYMIRTRLISGNRILNEDYIKVNDSVFFDLDPYEYTEVSGVLTAEASNTVILAELIDYETGRVTGSVYTSLTPPLALQTPQPGVTPAPSTDIMSSVTVMIVLMMLVGFTGNISGGYSA